MTPQQRMPDESAVALDVAMGFRMNSVKTCALGFAALTALSISGCALGSGSEPEPRPAPPQQDSAQIQSPKDAHAVPLCDLLPPAAAQSLGFPQKGEEREDSLNSDQPHSCSWRSGGSDSMSLDLSVQETPIAQMSKPQPQWSDFATLTVAGHPAVRANMGDPAKYGYCSIFLGTQENQVVVSQIALPGNEIGKTDGCQIAQKALEAAVPGLPPAK